MKDWQKNLLGGLAVGSLGIVPLLFWLAEIRVNFRCPNCDELITVCKRHKQMRLQLKAHQHEGQRHTDESEDATDLSIATAPTV
ncbi:MAG: hypothetical protein O7E52_25170 [Candidatus Poribacteria bacterium]|nr:hypothetical protein [Candidatus Poribacteria bacterium]